MSLILGIYSKKGEINPYLIKPVIDDFRLHRDVDVISGKRFSIAGCKKQSSSIQIFESSKKDFIAGVSGEILDFQNHAKELQKKGFGFQNKKNCAEFILNSFLSSGKKFPKDLMGTFTLGIYDSNKDELFLANDHFGTYPLFIYSDEEYFIFSNEYEPILKFPKFNFVLDEEALAEYFFIGAPLSGKTFFRSIRNLSPATMLRVSGSSVTENCYDIKNIDVNRNKDLKDFASDFANFFRLAVNLRTQNSENHTCSLTGGLDTRLILSAMPEEKRKKTRFISLLTQPLTEEEDRDVLIAKMIASRLGLNHVVQPLEEWSAVWTKDFDVSFFRKNRYWNKDYIISGYYGSELVKGEFISLVPDKINKLIEYKNKSLFQKFRYGTVKNSSGDIIPDIFLDDFKKHIPQVYDNLDKELLRMDCENKELQFSIYYMTRSFFSNMYGGSYGSWLMTYRFPIDISIPFLDADIIRLLLTMPVELIIHKDQKFYNEIYKEHFPELIDIPTSSYFGKIKGNCIPFFEKGKEPKKEKQPKYEKAFERFPDDTMTGEMNIFDKKKIGNYKGQGNHSDIRALIEFETWYRFVKQI